MSVKKFSSTSSGKRVTEAAAHAYERKMRMFFGIDQTCEQVAKAVNAARNHHLGKLD